MKRRIWITILLLGILGYGVFAFFRSGQFFGYLRLLNAQELLANPSVKPLPIQKIWQINSRLESAVCLDIDKFALANVPRKFENVSEFIAMEASVHQTFRESVKIVVDGKSSLGISYQSLVMTASPITVCVLDEDLDGLDGGYHIASIEFDDPFGKHHSYTWVFEVTADGVVPEVTATVVQ